MYTEHFGLRQKPFNLVPDPSFLYLSKEHKKALLMLEYSLVNSTGFTVITGEIGAGKTTLIRALLDKMGEDVVVGVINNTHSAFGELMVWVLDALDIQSNAQDNAGRYRDYVDFVAEQHGAGKRVILIVDEAQNLSIQALEELRLLSNVNIASDVFLQLILTGQPELGEKLNKPELEQFAQRIGIEFHLKRLTYPETQKYIEHRLMKAGAKRHLFSNEACAIIYCYSEGIPRKINNLCDFALVYAFADDKEIVDTETILEMIKEKKDSRIITSTDRELPDIIRVKKWLLEKFQIQLR